MWAKLAQLAGKYIARRAAARLQHNRTAAVLLMLPAVPMAIVLFVILLALLALVAIVAGMNSGGCGNTSPTITPPGNIQTEAQYARYLESQGISANGAAGIVGNIQQESGGNPADGGGGLVQWNAGWYAEMAAYATANGQSPTSAAGQLMYLVYDLRAHYAKLLADLNAAPDPGTAATEFETGYELCSGVTGYMQVSAGSLCMDQNRRQYAATVFRAAGGGSSTVLVADTNPGGDCVTPTSSAGYVNPLARVQGLTPERIDMGVDYAGTGPVLAIGAGTIVNTDASGWPGTAFIEIRLSEGAYAGKYFYSAECITPSVAVNQTVQAGQVIGTMTNCGSGTEWGWGTGRPGEALAASLNQQDPSGDVGGWSSAAGVSASRFLQSVGAPAGVMQPGGGHGTMPSEYP